ncbi:MAG TPA: hypothetical protein VGM37_01525 [Armatimonadota bacterium]
MNESGTSRRRQHCFAESVAAVWEVIGAAQERSGSAPRLLRIDLEEPADLRERKLIHDYLQAMVLPYTAEIITPWVHMRNHGRQHDNPRPVALCGATTGADGRSLSSP